MIDRIREAESDWGSQVLDAREAALNYAAMAREHLTQAGERIKQYVAEKPARALGIALGLGVLVGWIIKRR